MFFETPEEMQELDAIITPYLKKYGGLRGDAPEYVKEAYEKFCKMFDDMLGGCM